jgi:hypothetical protein
MVIPFIGDIREFTGKVVVALQHPFASAIGATRTTKGSVYWGHFINMRIVNFATPAQIAI